MLDARHDVLGIGNAIVDILAMADDAFLIREGLAKGSMNLVDEARSTHLYEAMGPAVEASGGSAANTIAGVASLGGRGAYIGKVKADDTGRFFTHDMRAIGVTFDVAPLIEGPATAKSMIFVTPDGERTMNTFLGACHRLTPDDVDPDLVAGSAVTYMEGYLWDPPAAKEAFLKAAAIAHGAGRRVAITLSDSFCVDRFRDEFLHLMRSGIVDTVFANEHELHALYQTADFDTALAALRADTRLGIVTRSENGAIVVEKDETVIGRAFAIDRLVDTTGAGDLFAAGFLHGLTRGFAHAASLKLGALAAAEVIQHMGPRPQVSLRALAQDHGLPV